ncbi:exlusion protein FxsA [Nocardiopsis gilva YIM 90087]|uniref:Exlusion protein FxsA n=1 Tax=Nocardiopsis gilva YIM 90087 TaxID=1235441 RepID=A0A223S6K5_9ACTN|nr:FxsA family protein [Nocardiopsis gilva]ASU83722.1 exlusion protein FxsA [Nocardiopsis gilva YIM 90087]
MPLLIVLALMALPFLEIWLMILVGSQIGVPWTIAALFLLSASGVVALRGAGTKAFREADEAMRTGAPPQGGLLDTLMVMVGGILLITPGFLTGAVGAVLALPFTRPALRWAFIAWAERRIKKMGVPVNGAFAPSGGPVAGERPGSGKVVPGVIVEDEAPGAASGEGGDGLTRRD